MLEVADLDSSVAFYRDLVGLEVVVEWDAPRSGVWLSIGRNGVIGLWPASSGGPGVGIAGSRGGAHVHFAVYVPAGNLSETKARLETAGHSVEGPVTFDHGNQSIFVSDPDGNVVQLGDWSVDWAGDPVVT